MKKISLFLFLLVTSFVFAETVIFSDKFSNINNWNNTDLTGANPTNGIWKMINGSTDTFVLFQSYSINAAQTDYVNDGLPENGALSLKNSMNCASYSKVYIDFESIFQYPTGGTTTPNTAGRGYLEISTNNTSWTTALTLSANEAIVRRLDISQWAGSQATVYIRFRYQSNFSGYWQLNNLKVYNPDQVNVGVFNVSTNPTIRTQNGIQMLGFVLYNYGSDTVKNVSLDFKSDAAATPEALNLAVTIPPLSSVSRNEGLNWMCPNPGIFQTNLAVKNVNGGSNANTLNTNFNKLAIVYGGSNLNPRIPLFEVFTSSTCPPCNPGNANLHSIIDSKDSNEYNVLKFQQDFPGTGDPYATDELVSRRGYYGINSIPRMEIDGEWDGNANSFTEALYGQAIATQSFFDLKGTFFADTTKKEISVSLDIKPLTKLFTGEFRVHYAVVERLTTKNKKTNGETSFSQVVKKMLPDVNGTLLENVSASLMNANSTFKHSIVYSQKGSYRLPADGTAGNRINLSIGNTVENFNNLYVVAWVESKTEGLVLQSARLTKSSSATGGGGGGGGTLSVSDSVFKSVDSNASLTVSNTEVTKYKKLTAGKEYSWVITSTSLPSYWSMLSICDKFDCYFPPILSAKKFTADADSTKNFLKIDIQHNKKTGYGYVVLAVYDKLDSANTVKTTKFSLLVKKGTGGTGSVSKVEDAKDFYLADNKLYFTSDVLPVRFNIVTIDGKQVYTQSVTNGIEDINASIAKGVYFIEVEYSNKTPQILKVQF